MALRRKVLLVGIGGSFLDEDKSAEANKAVWMGGGPDIWRACLTAVKEAGLTYCGIATLWTQKNELSLSIERELAGLISPQHVYYDSSETRNKEYFALRPAVLPGSSKQDVCLLDDQDIICRDVEAKGYPAVCSRALGTLAGKSYAPVRQQHAIVEFFFDVSFKLKLAPSRELVQLALDRNLLIAAYDGNRERIEELLMGVNARPNLMVRDFEGRTPQEVAQARGFQICARLLQTALAETIQKNAQFRFFAALAASKPRLSLSVAKVSAVEMDEDSRTVAQPEDKEPPKTNPESEVKESVSPGEKEKRLKRQPKEVKETISPENSRKRKPSWIWVPVVGTPKPGKAKKAKVEQAQDKEKETKGQPPASLQVKV